jgi:hypothetical protein
MVGGQSTAIRSPAAASAALPTALQGRELATATKDIEPELATTTRRSMSDTPAGDGSNGSGDRGDGLVPAGLPSRGAYILAFLSVLLAGAFGGIIGYGLVDVGCSGDCGLADIVGLAVGAISAAVGVGIVAVLVLRAMAEWQRGGKRAR